MILFHGTLEENLKNIQKNGILAYTADQWIMEVTQQKVCCISNQPTSGEGGNPAYFTYGFAKSKNQEGYLIVLDVPREILQKKIIVIFDNKVLDDYVKFHFFVREEFRKIGFLLWEKMTEYQNCDRYFRKFDDRIHKRLASEEEQNLYTQDQRSYYKKLRENRYVYNISGLLISDELFDMMKYIGNWQRVYEFLQLHFNQNKLDYKIFEQSKSKEHEKYWKNFYTNFPLTIDEDRNENFRDWFSPNWLAKRQITEPNENCQLLCKPIEPCYIAGFIKITTPSGYAERFRNFRSKSVFISEIWKEVHRILKEYQ